MHFPGGVSDRSKFIQKENDLFLPGGGRSKFFLYISVRPDPDDFETGIWNLIDSRILENGKGRKYRIPGFSRTGMHYLFYSHFMDTKQYVKPGSKFKIKLTIIDPKYQDEILDAFLLMYLFGGLGINSRKGAGTYEILKVQSKEITSHPLLEFLKLQNSSLSEFKKFLLEKRLFQESGSESLFLNRKIQLMIFQGRDSWEEALEFLGKSLLRFQNKKNWRIISFPKFFHLQKEKIHFLPTEGISNQNPSGRIDKRFFPIILKVLKINGYFYPFLLYIPGLNRLDNQPVAKGESMSLKIQKFLKSIMNMESESKFTEIIDK